MLLQKARHQQQVLYPEPSPWFPAAQMCATLRRPGLVARVGRLQLPPLLLQSQQPREARIAALLVRPRRLRGAVQRPAMVQLAAAALQLRAAKRTLRGLISDAVRFTASQELQV